MAGKRRYVGGALVVALGLAIVPLEGQRGQGPGDRGPRGPNLGQAIELALENQGDLSLTPDQLSQLQELKATIDGDVAGLAEEMATLREGIRSGEVDREDGLRQMQALRGELMTASAPLRGRVQEILTVEQHQKLQPLVREDRPGLGRAGASQGAGRAAFRGRSGGRGLPGAGGGVLGAPGPRGGFNGPGWAAGSGSRPASPMARSRRGIGGNPGAGGGGIGGLR